MNATAQREQFATLGYAVFEGLLLGKPLEILRRECGRFVAREYERMDRAGVDSLGLSHRGRRYFANECQREQPALRPILLGAAMAEVCRATLGDDAYFLFDQFVVKGPETGLPFGWRQDSGYMVGNGGPADHRSYLTCWCPLDDATVDNGTVRILPFPRAPASRDAILAHERQAETSAPPTARPPACSPRPTTSPTLRVEHRPCRACQFPGPFGRHAVDLQHHHQRQ